MALKQLKFKILNIVIITGVIVLFLPTPTSLAKNYHNKARNWKVNHGIPLMQKINHNHQITYQLNTNNPLYKKAYQNAINAWNQLKIITLTPTDTNPQIEMTEMIPTSQNMHIDGNTDYNIDKNIQKSNNFKYQYFNQTVITMHNTTKKATAKQLLNYTTFVAEHELGHALGFDHNNTTDLYVEIHIMNSNYTYQDINNIVSIGQYEKQTLISYYRYKFNN